MVTAMNPSSIIKKPELFSNLSQELCKKVLYPIERGKGQTYNGSIECDTRNTTPPPNSISNSNVMGKEVMIKQNLGEIQSESIANQSNENPTMSYSQPNENAITAELEQITMGLQNNHTSMVANLGKIYIITWIQVAIIIMNEYCRY